MIIEVHANPRGLSPAAFADLVAESGLDAVVVTLAHSVEGLSDFIEAIEARELEAFAGVELTLSAGRCIFVPKDGASVMGRDWSGDSGVWSSEALEELRTDLDGVLLASHPYYRSEDQPLGDRVYRLGGLAGVVTRLGRGRSTWDRLADQVAEKKGICRLGSSGGDLDFLGSAGTVLSDEIDDQASLVEALKSGLSVPVEFDDPATPRDRTPPERPRRNDSSGDRGRGGRRDERGRRDARGRRDDGGRRRDGRGRGGRGRRRD